ncbi:hypothetical protein PISL3812_03353 [Talaromyces islandicus]|uniref:Uncharacterized protein n=1 Tax=Talaromyces islandicus TaxID=28573 RepID=A0A0U1LSI8_TALIS|nr:hypothetical protein PISL3812_03353 [Talaromyces islandicus]
MHAISQVLVPTIALLAMVQYCPAPFIPIAAGLAASTAEALGTAAAAGASAATTTSTVAGVVGAAGGVAGAVEGGISAANSKRDLRNFNSRIKKRQDVSKLGLGTAWPNCINELGSAHLTFSSPSSSSVIVQGMPPACMTLCGVLTNVYNEGNPVPEGTDSVRFTNLTPGDIQEIQDALNGHPNYQH